jgi:diguanylate cyclase (GGDEF)-like protein
MRILVVDDEAAIRVAYRSVFQSGSVSDASVSLQALASDLFNDVTQGTASAEPDHFAYEVDYASQGLEAVAMVEEALHRGQPYQLIFLDMRMPPGIDGKETARRIRLLDHDVHFVIVTGYSEHSPADVARVAGPVSKIYYLSKPFEVEEILQIARALGERYKHDADALRAQILSLEEANRKIRASEAQALRAAYQDVLTGAPNRAAFVRELERLLARQDSQFHITLIDLDRFKNINDTLGHSGGDEMLRQVWRDLQSIAGPQVFAARLGGDEFGLIFSEVDADYALEVSQKAADLLSRERMIQGQLVVAGASMGLASHALYEDADTISLMRKADLALQAAKAEARRDIRVFDQSLEDTARSRRQIEIGLANALHNDELSLVYQPIVAQAGQQIVGFECLIRWNSAELGQISPAVFIPIAEQCGLIHDLTEWILPRALAECARWEGQYVSINFSPREFRRRNLVESLHRMTIEAGLKPSQVQLEITETALFEYADGSVEVMQRLRKLGFRVALDDFGTGYSSLFHLRNFEIDCIKVDKSFVDNLGRDQSSSAIVVSVAHLARALGVSVVAEGVEDAKQMAMLKLAGCSHLQGYHLGRPMAGADALLLVERQHSANILPAPQRDLSAS